ncbi:hypothetical protein HN412_02335 [archaeon]|jgi:hypothetical protein|nr:hypothetical protein [archaeon]MBT6735419.1 hypothetical protein [Candidatus Woesearchaeota archaeon]MBT7106786.1 hypothetical protein [archaeon]MBT7297294.1 hypothetical protein [archaeon]
MKKIFTIILVLVFLMSFGFVSSGDGDFIKKVYSSTAKEFNDFRESVPSVLISFINC